MTSTPPPPPPTSGSRPFIIVALLMLLVLAALLVYRCSGDDEKPPEKTPEPVATQTAPIPDQIVPPPPPIPSAVDAGTSEPAKKTTAAVQSTFCPTCGKCTGTPAANFQSIVRGRAQAAQRCYEKALAQQDQLQGKLTVNLCVGVGGGVCSASIASDSLGSPLVSQCVLNIFRATTFPSPKNGCVDAQVPLNFVPQKQ